MCPGSLSVAVINTITKSNLMRTRIYFIWTLLGHKPSSRKVKAGTQGRSLRQKPRKNATSRLTSSGLLSCLFLQVCWPPEAWALLHQLAIKAVPHRHARKSNWWGNSSAETPPSLCLSLLTKITGTTDLHMQTEHTWTYTTHKHIHTHKRYLPEILIAKKYLHSDLRERNLIGSYISISMWVKPTQEWFMWGK